MVATINQIAGFGAGGAAASNTTVSHVDNAGDGTDQTTFTFSAQTLGTGKIVVVLGGGNNAVTVSSVTVDGNSASSVVQASNVNLLCEMWQYNNNTAASGDVAVTFSGSEGRCAVGIYLVTGAGDNATQTGTSTAQDGTFDLDIPANGIAIAAQFPANNPTTIWTGLTEDFEQSAEATENVLTGASDAFAAAQTNLTITGDQTGTGDNAFVCAAFGPA